MDRYFFIACVLLLLTIEESAGNEYMMTTDDMENFINPEDLRKIVDYYQKNSTAIDNNATMARTTTPRPEPQVGCFGIGGFMVRVINRMVNFNLAPASSNAVNTHFYFSSRKMKFRVQVYPGRQFGIESVDFDPKRKTVMIVHGFMSYSGADWVTNMTRAYLEREDVNVIAVDWSGGSNTLKYWRAAANTRTVGRDIATFMGQLKNATGLNIKHCHFIGHSLGAQIASFASSELGKVGRITGLDPALPCFNTTSTKDRLDSSDADFVDVIHTNGGAVSFGFGFPYPMGHIDFYPNGGIRQPGCFSSIIPLYNTIDQAICSHGRAYLLFTESLFNRKCSFTGFPWDLSAAGVRKCVETNCEGNTTICPEMGIRAAGTARGSFLVITEDKGPFCVSDWDQHHPSPDLLRDITTNLQHLRGSPASNGVSTMSSRNLLAGTTTSAPKIESTTSVSWIKRVYNYLVARGEQIPESPDYDSDIYDN